MPPTLRQSKSEKKKAPIVDQSGEEGTITGAVDRLTDSARGAISATGTANAAR
jgi:hypothetical protein